MDLQHPRSDFARHNIKRKRSKVKLLFVVTSSDHEIPIELHNSQKNGRTNGFGQRQLRMQLSVRRDPLGYLLTLSDLANDPLLKFV
jgi:hypothetical protein